MLMKSKSLMPFENLAEGLKADKLDVFKREVKDTLTNGQLTEYQKTAALAKLAENTMPYPEVSDRAREFLELGVICNMFEGAAPYRPRYVSPDYSVPLRNGSDYLEMGPAKNLYDAVTMLLAAYSYVPSITGFPVFFGPVDELLEPYMDTVSEEEARQLLRMFWQLLDKQVPDGFAHANIGPRRTRAGEIMLELDYEFGNTVPNLSFKYDKDITDRDYVVQAVSNALKWNKPYIVNHKMNVANWGENYAVASCYNLFPIGGGSHTLTRLNLRRMVEEHEGDTDSFLSETLVESAKYLVEVINSRNRWLVEEVKFFENSFLAREGWIDLKNFTAMAGFVGLAEAVNILMEREGKSSRYGHDSEANELSTRIIARLHEALKEQPALHCEASENRVIFHAQTGIDVDIDITPGARVPVNDEPHIYGHIETLAPHDKYFDGGVSSIFVFDNTARDNPEAVLDMVHAALDQGLRLFAVTSGDSELIRISGWLMKRIDLEKFRQSDNVRMGSSNLGSAGVENLGHLQRRVNYLERSIVSGDRDE